MKKEMNGKHFLPVTKDEIVALAPLRCNLYIFLPLNNRMFKIRNQHQTLSTNELELFVSKGHLTFYVLDPVENVGSYLPQAELPGPPNPVLPIDILAALEPKPSLIQEEVIEKIKPKWETGVDLIINPTAEEEITAETIIPDQAEAEAEQKFSGDEAKKEAEENFDGEKKTPETPALLGAGNSGSSGDQVDQGVTVTDPARDAGVLSDIRDGLREIAFKDSKALIGIQLHRFSKNSPAITVQLLIVGVNIEKLGLDTRSTLPLPEKHCFPYFPENIPAGAADADEVMVFHGRICLLGLLGVGRMKINVFQQGILKCSAKQERNRYPW